MKGIQKIYCIFFFILTSNSIYSQFSFKQCPDYSFKKTLKHWTWKFDKELTEIKQGDSITFNSNYGEAKFTKAYLKVNDSTAGYNYKRNPIGDIKFSKHKKMQKLFVLKKDKAGENITEWRDIGQWTMNEDNLKIFLNNTFIELEWRQFFNEFIDFKVVSVKPYTKN